MEMLKKPLVNIDDLDPKEFIVIKGARVNNLKNLSVAIPRNKLVVVTGLSGSGKSSLAFDTLYAEGQRMYVESLSSYARQFLGRMEKPEVDYIRGLSPAIAIEQKVNTRNPRSTVGTTTEIYDYLKLFFARVGTTYSPISGKEVVRDTVTGIVDKVMSQDTGLKVMITCPLAIHEDRSIEDELKILLSKGYTRVLLEGELKFIDDLIDREEEFHEAEIFIDRVITSEDEELQFRLTDSIQTALFESHGDCFIYMEGIKKAYSDRFELDGITFEEPSVNFFSFNNPYGACKKCEGFGKVLGLDPDLVIPDQKLSLYEGAVAPWKSEAMSHWVKPFIQKGIDYDFPIHRPYKDLSDEEKKLIWEGNDELEGLNAFFDWVESQVHKIQYRVMLSRYRGKTVCPDCRGTRLRKDADYVKVDGKSITDTVLMPVDKALSFFSGIDLKKHHSKIASRLLTEISTRLGYLTEVGLGYLTLNRVTSTLSGGEYQRIKLATSLGSALVGSIYVLDEPSIGLHPRDTAKLVGVVQNLKHLGNTVIVVEHEEEVMKAADQIIDIGPGAGSHGGELIFQGSKDDMTPEIDSHTVRYMTGVASIPVPEQRRKWYDRITLNAVRENNLKSMDVSIPLGVMTVITGVSGSGKSTLVQKILYPALGRRMGIISDLPGKFNGITGDVDKISFVEFVDQNPIGKSSRSNPVTYVKAYDPIRQLFAELPLSKQRGFKPSFFSFNVDGGRCEECQGEGVVKIEMQFMADIHLTCENCKGNRFKSEILDVEYEGKSISDVLELTIDEAMEFFAPVPAVISKLKPLQDVGMGYITMGQSSNSLSGGEAQRVKLASFLGKPKSTKDHILFIFDEPTTGLHFHDISKLMESLNRLVDYGHSVLVIEHNVEVIKLADWIIDLGPEGGENGGNICFEGTPEQMISLKESNYTAQYLAEKLNR